MKLETLPERARRLNRVAREMTVESMVTTLPPGVLSPGEHRNYLEATRRSLMAFQRPGEVLAKVCGRLEEG